MSHHRLATPDIERIFRGETVSGLSEWQLLERYLERRDEIAFEALVARHGPMVLAVCRRMLADHGDVEDAFQATFLVLVRRARQLGPRDAIGPWLYGVAARVALRARSQAARRRRSQPIAGERFAAAADAAPIDRELCEVLDQELSRLPSKYRSPIVLCYLEGQTHEEAARSLAWPVGTVKGRLARARDLLRCRLARRGVTPTVSALTLVLAGDSKALIHRELLDRTVKSSLKLAMGHTAAGVVSTSIASLAQGVLSSMLITKLKWAGAAVLVSGLALTGVGVAARQNAVQTRNDPPAAVPAADDSAVAKPTGPAGASLKEERAVPNSDERAIPNIDAKRYQLLVAARTEWRAARNEYLNNSTGLERAYQASKRLMNAEEQIAAPHEQSAPARSHFDRIREIARMQHNHPSASEPDQAQVQALVSEAELWAALATEKESRAEKPVSPGGEAGPKANVAAHEPRRPEEGTGIAEGRGRDTHSRRILAALDKRISMPFDNETPLEDVIKYVKQVTGSPDLPGGIPIYVDPVGLQEAEKSMTSTMRGMNLDGIPLRRTLQLLLKQLDLVYFVDDGILCITSQETEDQISKGFGPSMAAEPSALMEKLGKAERGELELNEMKELVEIMKTLAEIRKLQHPDDPKKGPQ